MTDAGKIVGLGVSVGAVAALVVAGRQARGDVRAALYGAATGIEFGLTAALMKGAMVALSSGFLVLLSAWQTYAMVAAGIFGMFLVQNAMQSGKILAAQPGITLLDPFVAIVWGIFGFDERVSGGGLHLVLAVAGGLVMVGGALLLSHSPVLQGEGHAPSANRETHPDNGTEVPRRPGSDAGEPEPASA